MVGVPGGTVVAIVVSTRVAGGARECGRHRGRDGRRRGRGAHHLLVPGDAGHQEHADDRRSGRQGTGGGAAHGTDAPRARSSDRPERGVGVEDVDRQGIGPIAQCGGQLVVVEPVVLVHQRSSRSSTARRRRRASCRCDFTEPSASPMAAATSATDNPST